MSPADPAKLFPLFFFSYAHDSLSSDDQLVRQFFGDLRSEVRVRTTVPDNHVGFLDSDSLRAGHRWSPELVRALADCQVFVALCSPRYFSRPSCGKEWTVFDDRLRAHERRTRRSAPSLIPLFWVPMSDGDLPAAAKAYQYRDPFFGPAYAEHGVRALAQIGWHRDAYQDFVARLARRIIELAKDHRLPAAERRPEFDTILPAFPDSAGDPRVQARSAEPNRPTGTNHGGPGTSVNPSAGRPPSRHPAPYLDPRPILSTNPSTSYPSNARPRRQNDNDAQEPEER